MLSKWLDPWRAYHRLRKLPRARRRLVVYSEGGESAVFFRPILDALINDYGLEFLLVTSDAADPLIAAHPELETFFIGFGAARTAFFQTLQADMVLMTTPDLGHFHLKRSAGVGHYSYVHHSVVSSHMAYRPGAFDHYDSVLCSGPHHVSETRAWEVQKGLPAKTLVEHGYGPIDALMSGDPRPSLGGKRPTILVAPSWGKEGVIESCGAAVCQSLLEAGMRVILRPHPRTLRSHRHVVEILVRRLGANADFILDLGAASHEIYREADAMVSDWSGAAFEFAFGLLRPVLFVDVPRKVNNPQYQTLEREPLEVVLRSRVGVITPVDQSQKIGCQMKNLLNDSGSWRERIAAERGQWIFNLGSSGVAAAQFIAQHLGVGTDRSVRGNGVAPDRPLKDRIGNELIAGRGEVESLLARLLQRDPLEWDQEDVAALHQLARKVEVSKRLWSSYGAGWSNLKEPAPVDPSAWPAVVAAFLLAAEQKGEHYKFLNAALRALDLISANGSARFAGELRRGCQTLLDTVDQ